MSKKRARRGKGGRAGRPPAPPGDPPPKRAGPTFRFPVRRDVETFAAELGMDLEFDGDQQWLIDQALASALPPLWRRLFNPHGRAYYVREPTKQEPHEVVTWAHPLVPAYSKIFDNILAEQAEAQKIALGIVSEDDEDDEDDEDEGAGGADGAGAPSADAPKLSGSQKKKLRASTQDALLYYKKVLGDPSTEDVRPREEAPGYWNVEPEDVEDMAEYLGIDPATQPHLMWVARIAASAPLAPGWSAHSDGDDISNLVAERRGLSLDELGVVYTCKSWMCKTDALAARMSLDAHPSEQYVYLLLAEAKEEYGENEEDADGEDEFGMPIEVVPCEFRNDSGAVYVYDFATEEATSTGRVVKDEDDEDEVEDVGEGADGGAGGSGSNAAAESASQGAPVAQGPRADDAGGGDVSATAAAAAQQQDGAEASSDGGAAAAPDVPREEGSISVTATPEVAPVPMAGDLLLAKLDHESEGTLSEKQILEFCKHIGLDLHGRRNKPYFWVVETALLRDEATDREGWIYRADPTGRFHYYRDNVTLAAARADRRGGPDLTQGEGVTSGWNNTTDAEETRQVAAGEDQAAAGSGAAIAPTSNVGSSWKHPLVAKYKQQLNEHRERDAEARRVKRVRGLRAKSTRDHTHKMTVARATGGQAIVIEADTGEPCPLTGLTGHQAVIRAPRTAARAPPNAISPNKRSIPLQPGFGKEGVKYRREVRAARGGGGSGGGGEGGGYFSGSGSDGEQYLSDGGGSSTVLASMKADAARAKRAQEELENGGPAVPEMHRAFRDAVLVDTTEAKRQLEEERRIARRKKKSGRHKKKRPTRQRRSMLSSSSSPSFPPLELDATAQLGAISLQVRRRSLGARKNASDLRADTAESLVFDGSYVNQDRDPTPAGNAGSGDMWAGELDGAAVDPKKGLLSPALQGGFAAVGNLVPVPSSVWERAHSSESPLVGPTTLAARFDGESMDDRMRGYRAQFDARHAEDDAVIDRWLEKTSLDDDGGVDDGGNGRGGSHGNVGAAGAQFGFSVTSASSFSVKTIALKPLGTPPRTPKDDARLYASLGTPPRSGQRRRGARGNSRGGTRLQPLPERLDDAANTMQ